MKRTTMFALSVLVLAVMGGCRKEESSTSTTMLGGESASTDTTLTSPAGTAPPGITSTLAPADQDFVMKAAKAGMAEVQLGTNVASRAASADVKAFAQRMITDHNQANQELMAFAASRRVDPPADIDPEKKTLDADLTKLSGKALDKKYMEAMVKDHEMAVADFEKASREAADPDLKAWAAKTLPTLQMHHQMARDISAKLK